MFWGGIERGPRRCKKEGLERLAFFGFFMVFVCGEESKEKTMAAFLLFVCLALFALSRPFRCSASCARREADCFLSLGAWGKGRCRERREQRRTARMRERDKRKRQKSNRRAAVFLVLAST